MRRWLSPTRLQYIVDKLHLDWGTSRRLLSLPFPLNNELTYFYLDAWEGATHGSGAAGAAPLGVARSKLGGTMIMSAEPRGSFKYAKP